jgi:large subunit ribosomal protein L3
MDTIIATKKEMTQVYDSKDGKALPVTILDISDVRVVDLLKNKDQVSHIVIGKGEASNSKSNKPKTGKYKDTKSPAITHAVSSSEAMDLGTAVDGSSFAVGDTVKVTGVTKGKGFQGVVKRWGFAGGPRTHGASDKERHPGSLGQRMTPGRVFKGMKMGGHMGSRNVSIRNLKIVKVDIENKLILVRGAVPGAKGSHLIVSKLSR